MSMLAVTSHPLAACRASCLAEGGDGADGWEDERRDKKAFGKTKISWERPGFPPSVGNKTPQFCVVAGFVTKSALKMSTSRQLSESRAIPTRTVLINDATQLPHDYCTTPGGTLFSTTPGGTRIIYDRKFLLDRRNSPIAQTPPAHLPVIPGVTSRNVLNENQKNEANNHINNHDGKPATGEDAQFEMDI